jgi:heme-degrading monooxygenase HmoA
LEAGTARITAGKRTDTQAGRRRHVERTQAWQNAFHRPHECPSRRAAWGLREHAGPGAVCPFDGQPAREGLAAMFARLSSYQGSPVPAGGDLTANWEAILQQVKDVPGFRGMYYLVDRAAGKAKSLTLWDDEQTMRDSENVANRLREETARREGQQIVSVERFEVGFSHLKP